MDILLLKLDDHIPGESTRDGYQGQIEILSFSHGLIHPITGDRSDRTRTSGHPEHQDFNVTKYLDRSSVGILDACNRGTALPEVTFTVGQMEESKLNPYWTVVLRNAVVASVSVGGGGGGKPTETVSLNYTSVTWTYTLQTAAAGPSTTTSGSWNLATNSAVPAP